MGKSLLHYEASLICWDVGEQRLDIKTNQDVSGLNGQAAGDVHKLACVGQVVGCVTHQGLENFGEVLGCSVSSGTS